MNPLSDLLLRQPVTFVHLACAVATLLLGGVILARRKGSPGHRVLGWIWVVLMAGTVISSALIRGHHLPNIAGFTPIHLLTVMAGVFLPLGIWQIRRGNVQRHRATMRGLYIGGCVVAGMFTLAPGRFLGGLLAAYAQRLWA